MSGDGSAPRRVHRTISQLSLPRPNEGRLSIIVEDGDVPPVSQVPSKSQRRPFSRIFFPASPPRHSFESPPPRYSPWDVPGPKGEKLTVLRNNINNNRHIAGRGGWKRLVLLVLVVIAVIIALAVGLTIGLRKSNSTSAVPFSSTPTSSPSSDPSGPFPIGSYSLNTFLDSVSTNCTSNSATWRCYPYATYADSPSLALATFNWIISPSENGLTISSTDNPFAINFADVPLTMTDNGTENERYFFSVPNNKVVIPSTSITTDNSMASCQYNNTQLQASLFTHTASSYPPNSSVSTGSSTVDSFRPWPFAVQVSQSIGGGVDVPACFEVTNGTLGAPVTNGLVAQPSQDFCSCVYKNYDA
ncbi:hypothetical protein MMC11_007544 [Xylographa trunciseda]|nr:hypothetical protein [Xylographa trunciseda]